MNTEVTGRTKVEIASDSDMKVFGARLGKLLRGGEVLELIGDVGAGKTTLVKGIAGGMGVDEDVQSPTFTISRVYATTSAAISGGTLELAHYDFYRLNDPGIMANELQETAFDDDVVTIIEWGDIVEGVLPADRLTISITSSTETTRSLELQSHGPKSEVVLRGVA